MNTARSASCRRTDALACVCVALPCSSSVAATASLPISCSCPFSASAAGSVIGQVIGPIVESMPSKLNAIGRGVSASFQRTRAPPSSNDCTRISQGSLAAASPPGGVPAPGWPCAGGASCSTLTRPCASRVSATSSPSKRTVPRAAVRSSGCTSVSPTCNSRHAASGAPARSASAMSDILTPPRSDNLELLSSRSSKCSDTSACTRPRCRSTGRSCGRYGLAMVKSKSPMCSVIDVSRSRANGVVCAPVSNRVPSNVNASRGSTATSTCDGRVDRNGSVSSRPPTSWRRATGRSSKLSAPSRTCTL